ncbi:MAG TPA: A/G-specific adenine glycosylase [Pseudogracilibacillus sp.]|nr:A/G-specific adenine glycosylase [Pseudogracilibacillus sp.]
MDKTLQNFDKASFVETLNVWYEANKRDLPWRKTKDPYKIWVSEIMLQQTKVDTVIAYYEKFMERFPTIHNLAHAEEQEVLKLWEGLGYYSRARNLHTAAQEVVYELAGNIPTNAEGLGKLKGIGPYTKGAISSIAYEQEEPAVDGNVMRVLSRVLNITDNISDPKTRRRFEEIIRELLAFGNPSSFNQGLMELGALICAPKNPACLHCPVRMHCRGLETGEMVNLPVKQKKKKQRVERYAVFLLQDETGKIAVEQRPSKGLLANMWQFPMLEMGRLPENIAEEKIHLHKQTEIEIKEKRGEVKHVFSHVIWELEIYPANVIHKAMPNDYFFLSPEEMREYPFSVAHQKVRAFLDT